VSLARAWNEVVHTRGLVRAEISRRRLPALASLDSAQVEAHDSWVRAERRLAQFEVRLASATRDAVSDSTRAAMRADVDEAERRWARGLPPSTLEDPGQVSLDSVRTHLGSDQALVAFVQVADAREERHLHALVARGGSTMLRSFDLGRVEELAALTRSWLAQLGETNPSRRSEPACRRAGSLVRSRVWDPFAVALSGVRDLFVVAEAPVSGLPLYALPEGRRAYLVESGVRLHVLDAEREVLSRPATHEGLGLLAVGGVDYDRSQEAVPGRAQAIASLTRAPAADCDSAALVALPPLPGTDAEAREVETSWRRTPSVGTATRLAGQGATERALKTLAPGHKVIHIATHGIALSDTCGESAPGTRGVGGVLPVASAPTGTGRPPPKPAPSRPSVSRSVPSPWLGRQVFLALANANHAREHLIDENEGLLTAEEVTTLDLAGVEWVVLSACQTAAGSSWTHEGRLGMQRAFHLAGARTVIASAWSVEDEATQQWMRALYDARARGASSAAQALASASRSVLEARRGAGKSTHPFYWAAFVASGE